MDIYSVYFRGPWEKLYKMLSVSGYSWSSWWPKQWNQRKLVPNKYKIYGYYLEIFIIFILDEGKKTWQRVRLAEPSSRFRPETKYRLYFKTVIAYFVYLSCNIISIFAPQMSFIRQKQHICSWTIMPWRKRSKKDESTMHLNVG